MVVRKFCRVLQLALCTGLAAACAVQPGPLYTAVQAAAPAVGGTPLAVIRHLRARSQSVPAVLLYQLPEMANGCEATSLTMLLQSYGFAADKLQIAYEYVPREEFYEQDGEVYGPAPDDAYAGDPVAYGYYCFAQPLCQAADAFLRDAGETLRAQDLTGISTVGLEQVLCDGRPVVVWGTLLFETPQYSTTYSWRLPETGEVYIPYSNLHCMLLYGYDEDYYYLCDPLYGYQMVEKARFSAIYEQMGRRAMTLDGPVAIPARNAE